MNNEAFNALLKAMRAFAFNRQRETDRRWLQDVIAGRVDLSSPKIFERLEPMFALYDSDLGMTALLEVAADAYAAFAVEVAYWVLAGNVTTKPEEKHKASEPHLQGYAYMRRGHCDRRETDDPQLQGRGRRQHAI